MTKLRLLGALIILSSLILVGCEKGDDDRLAQAQACLDRATQATVAECENMVSGITGASAAFIRCSANFITQGFTGARFASAFQALKETQTGVNSTVAMMSYLVFTVGADDDARADYATLTVGNCNATGMAGMIMFASFARTATELTRNIPGGISPGVPPDPADLQANLAEGSDDAIAASVSAVATYYCGTSSGTKDVAFCTTINDAADEGSNAAIAAKLRALLGVVP